MIKRLAIPPGCAHCRLSRRDFLAAGCAACAGVSGLSAVGTTAGAADDLPTMRIRIIHSLFAVVQHKPTWPHVGFDFQPVMDRFVAELRARCPGVEFVTSTAADGETARQVIEADKNAKIDGYIVYQLNNWPNVVQPVAATGKPTLFVEFPYGGSGGFLVYSAKLLQDKTPNAGFISAARIEDVAASVECFAAAKKIGPAADFASMIAEVRRRRTAAPGDLSCIADPVSVLSPQECLAKVREAKILVVPGRVPYKTMGIDVVPTSFDELNEAWKAADKDQSRAIADRWEKTARAIVDVSRETLESSAAMYLAQKALLEKHGACAIAIDCLGGFYGGRLHAYPCLGFHELNNAGMVGACEADIKSTTSMIAMTALTRGRPGFISDPVIDTATRRIIYAHCVASNKPFGPEGPANPFEILTHSEDRRGAAVRSLFPLGYMTTTVEFDAGRKEVLFHQGKAVANVIDDRACRTKLAVEPIGDVEKLYRHWSHWGWHRVTVFGDLKEPVFALADALEWKVVQEA